MNVAMNTPSEIFVVGDRKKRRNIRGENWLEPNCTANSRIENTKPVNVIIPPANAPRTDSAAPEPNDSPIRKLVRSSSTGRAMPIAIATATNRPGTIHKLFRRYS